MNKSSAGTIGSSSGIAGGSRSLGDASRGLGCAALRGGAGACLVFSGGSGAGPWSDGGWLAAELSFSSNGSRTASPAASGSFVPDFW